MYNLIKPLLFKLDPELAHDFVNWTTRYAQHVPGLLSVVKSIYSYPSSRFSQKIWDVDFFNPIGLAAGFDKNAALVDAMSALGFGFLELGSVTNRPCQGNEKPRLFRLEKDSALINRMGLNNLGPYRFLDNLHNAKSLIPKLVSISKTNDPSLSGDKAIDDFCQCYRLVGPYVGPVVFNLSCPNTKDGKTFEDEDSLDTLLEALFQVKKSETFNNRVLVKFSSDVDVALLLRLVDVAIGKGIDGVVLCNTSNSREGLHSDAAYINSIGRGGLSGPPLFRRSIERVSAVYAHTAGTLPIVGVGGVDSPRAAIEMMKAGASLIEVYTGLVYNGPRFVKSILEELERELLSNETLSVKDIVGVSASKNIIS